jgi:hypothetical protein
MAAAEPVKVGMITTLSGGGASLGIDVRDGFELALKQAGNTDIELIIEDDARKPDLAVQLSDKLIQSDKVDIMTGIIWSNLAMAVIPGAVAQGKIYLSPNAGPSALAGAGCNENYFNVAWQNDNLHEAMGAYANTAGFKKSFILAPNYPAGQDALTGFKRFFKGEIANEIYTKLGQTDYAAEIAEIRASGADSVFFFLPGGMGIAFMKQYAGAGVDVPLLGPCLLLRSGHSPGRRRCRSWRQEHLAVVQGHRQRNQQGLCRKLPGRIWPSALALCQPGFRHRQPADLRHGCGVDFRQADAFLAHSRRPISNPPAAISSSDPTTTRSRTSMSAKWSRKATCSPTSWWACALEDHSDAYAADCKM